MSNITLIIDGSPMEGLSLTSLGSDLYRFNSTFCWGFFANDEEEIARFPLAGDVIRARRVEDNRVDFLEVHTRGCFKQFDYVLSRRAAQSQSLRALLARVKKSGGAWSIEMGGVLLVALPPESELDFDAELSRALGEA